MRVKIPDRPFQILLVLVLGVIAFGLLLELDWLTYTGLGIGLASALFPALGGLIAWAWMQLGKGLGWINGKILLSVVFFIFLVPVALIYQATRKNPLNLKDKADSLFRERKHTFSPKDLKDSW